ncbi:MAG: hypothetical protein ACXVGQ_00050 [Mycobacteriaceae bacterium]
MADEWEKTSGHRVSRSAIAMAIQRHGLTSAHPRPRYDDMLPWEVNALHRMAYDARMLRLEGRRRQGGNLSEDDKSRLTSWRAALEEANAVIIYDPLTPEGFHRTHRTEEDDDLIRRP